MIKVSVIVPVYKVPLDYLRECLDSLVAQTMQESEFIIVSDGASEAECSICEDYANKDSRFRLFRREHAGVSATRNYGIEEAQGEFITFVDADDWIAPCTNDTIYNFAKVNGSDIVLWEAQQIKGKVISFPSLYTTSKQKLSTEEITEIISNIIYTTNSRFSSVSLVCCKLFKRNLIVANNIQYPLNIKFSEDRVFNIKAYEHAQIISYTNKILYNYRIHTNSTSHSYTPNAFFVYIDFISQFNKQQKAIFSKSISTEYIRFFFLSWKSYYLHPQNKDSLKDRINKIRSIIQSENFQKEAWNHTFKELSKIIQIELIFFKHKLVLPFYVHAITNSLKNFLLKRT